MEPAAAKGNKMTNEEYIKTEIESWHDIELPIPWHIRIRATLSYWWYSIVCFVEPMIALYRRLTNTHASWCCTEYDGPCCCQGK